MLRLARVGSILSFVLSLILLPVVPATAGPQDDPPVVITPGNGSLLPTTVYSLTLTLDGSASNGGLEQGQVDQAKAAAAEAQEARTGADAVGSGAARAAAYIAGSSGSASGGSGGAVAGECSFRDANLPAGDAAWGGNDAAAGSLLVNPCNGPGQYLYVADPADPAPGNPASVAAAPPPPDPAVLAQQAYGELSLPKPEAHRSPDESNSDPALGGLPYTFVGLHTWTWVTDWQPLQRTVELRGVSATVTATPTSLVFDPGNGDSPVSCPGPGRPWTEADGNRPPTGGGCAYVYRAVTPAGPLTATTSITWSVVWTSNTGAGGAFPALSTASTSSFLVEQIQVVVQR